MSFTYSTVDKVTVLQCVCNCYILLAQQLLKYSIIGSLRKLHDILEGICYNTY